MSRFSEAPVRRLHNLPGSVGRNKELQTTEKSHVTPRPPQTARKAAVGMSAEETELSFRRPLQSARGRLETSADEAAYVQSRGAWRRTGKDFTAKDLSSASSSALDGTNTMFNRTGVSLNTKLAHDGRRTRFHRRSRVYEEIKRYEHLRHLDAAAQSPAAQRVYLLEHRLLQDRLTDTERAVLSYELAELKKNAHARLLRGADTELLHGADVAVGPIMTEKCAVQSLFHQTKQSNLDIQRLEEQLQESERQAEEKMTLVVSAISGEDAGTLGLKWEEVGVRRPESGTQIKSTGLAVALKRRQRAFTREELQKFGVTRVGAGSYIKAGQRYFRPAFDNVNRALAKTAQQLGDNRVPTVSHEKQVQDTRNTSDCEACSALENDLHYPARKQAKGEGRGRHDKDAIPRIELTPLQSNMLNKSLSRQEDEREALRIETTVREREDAARLLRLTEAQTSAMAHDQLQKERAAERQSERERQTSLKTVTQTWKDDVAEEFHERQKRVRALLIELGGMQIQADPIRGNDVQGKPIEEWDDKRVRKISVEGRTSTVPMADMHQREHRHFVRMVSLATDSKGRRLVADPSNHCVRRFNQDGHEEILAGSGDPERGGFADGPGNRALFLCPTGLAVDSNDNIYVADFYNNRIRQISREGMVSTLAGTGERGFEDGEASQALLDHPESVAIDAKGNVYVADWGNHRICCISLQEVPKPILSLSPGRLTKLTSKHSMVWRSPSKAFLLRKETSVSLMGTASGDEGKETESGTETSTPEPPSEKKWFVSTFAGCGHRGFKDAIGEAARFNHPHGIFIDDDGETVMVWDSHLDTAHKPPDDEEASRIAAEADKRRVEDLQHIADMDECSKLLHDGDFWRIGADHLKSEHQRHLDEHALGRLWRWSSDEAGRVDTMMARKAESMLKTGMMADSDITERIRAARKVEAFRRFHFRNVLRMLRRKEQKHIVKVELMDVSNTFKMGHEMDVAGMNAEALAIDKDMLHAGARQLRHFREELAHRFNSVYDAWIFFDMDGDGSMSEKEFLSLCMPLRLARDVSPHDVFGLIWHAHLTRDMGALKNAIDTDSVKEITPVNFVHVMRWHKTPLSDREVLLMLDTARDNRLKIHAMAIRRTAEQNETNDRAAAAAAEVRRKSHRQNPKIKTPVRVTSYRLPMNPDCPFYEPIQRAASVEPPPPPTPVNPVPQPIYALPEQLGAMNDKVELLLYHRKETGMKKLDGYDNRIKRVGCMLKESSLQRGYAWRLREAGDKDEKSHWDEFLLVLTEKGRLMMEPNDSQVAAANASARKLVLDFDMTAIVRHDAIEMQCLGGAGMQLIFRVQHGARRSNQFLYLAFGEKGSKEYEEWWRALRKFSWRADDINTDHLDSTKWKPDEKVIWDQIEQVFRQRYELRKVIKMQRWWRERKRQRADDAAKRSETLLAQAQMSRLTYLLKHHGPIGDQGGWMRNYQSYKNLDDRAVARTSASLHSRQAEALAMADTENHGKLAPARDCGAVLPATEADAQRFCVRCKGAIEPAGEPALICNAHLYTIDYDAHQMHSHCAAELFANGTQVVVCEKHTKNKAHLCGFWATSYPHLTRHASLRDADQSSMDTRGPTDIEQRLSLIADAA